MIDFSQRIAGLSPEKRALFELQLMKKAPYAGREQTIARRETSDPCPLSFAQQRLWFLDQLEPESALYNIGKAVRISGALDAAALRRTLDAIVARHEALRTTFTAVDGNPVQVVAESRRAELAVIDLSSLPATEQAAEVRRCIDGEARRPFNLSSDLMLRATLLRLKQQEHVLQLVMHHIASDGWSMGILSREISALYEAFSTERPPHMQNLPIQYPDFALWQREYLQGETLESQLAYWRRQLAGLPVLELPTDRPRPAIQTFRGARQPLTLPVVLSESLKALSRKAGVTLFMTLLAAFQTLLHRYAGQDNIVVGSPLAGRTRAETEELIGFFVNTLVLHTDLSGNPTFWELMKRVRDVALGAYAHQDLPFEKLVEELHPERDLSRNPIFQLWFALQNVPRQSLELAGSTVTPLEMGSGTAKFDLGLSMVEMGEELRGSLEYNTDLFNAATITRMLGHFETLLQGIVADPGQRLSDLPLLTQVERRQLLVEWNDTKRDFPKDKGIHQLFEAQAERTPEAVAVVFEDRQLTYGELNRRANQLAHYLRALGIERGGLVGICVERSLEMVIALLAILKAGGAYVPLDPAYPKERLAFMIEDSQLSVLLTQQRLLSQLPTMTADGRPLTGDEARSSLPQRSPVTGLRSSIICLDRDWEVIAHESTEKPVSEATVDDLAYVIFTSGSTGKPKGVRIPHRAVANFLYSMREQPGLTEHDTLLSVTTLSFDIAALEIFLPLTVGARVVVANREVASDGARLSDKLADSGATAMQATPATWRSLLEAGWQGNKKLKILCGGEALPHELSAQLLAKGSSLWNMYGPTETTIWSALFRVDAEDRTTPIGRPIANTQIYILDSRLQPVPVGIPGELHIGGDGVALGYLNRPDLTTEKFIPHPFDKRADARLYKTGDLVRYRPDGNIEFLGRLDHQVKIRGFRIELGEIEAALRQHPTSQQVVVMAREDSPGDKRLAAYMVPKQQPAPTATELRSFLREKLPDYMLPSSFVFLDALPLTPNGKVDRKALPVPDQARPESEKAFVPPSDALESQLTKIWEEVLAVKPVGVSDNFFDLGGHSLLAVRLFAQIKKFTGKNIALGALFHAPTVKQLADVIRQHELSATWSALVPIQPNGSRPPFFCVHGHDGQVLYFRYLMWRMNKDQPFYGIQPLGLDGKRTPPDRVEDMAAHYVKEIQAIQPKGPYFLAANCAGGPIAFEMAQQLHAQGSKVALLAMIDCHAPGCHRASQDITWLRSKIFRLAEKIERHAINLSLLSRREKLRYIQDSIGWWWKTRIQTRIQNIADRLEPGSVDSHQPLLNVQAAMSRALNNYEVKFYPGKITLFRPAKQSRAMNHDPEFGWGRFAEKGVEVHTFPGYHGLTQEPRARLLAKQLGDCLQRTQLAESGNS